MTAEADPAALFACALSLHNACLKAADTDPQLNLSECYNGMDQFMREVMRIGGLFENWACAHVAFDELEEVWPYLLEAEFGAGCLALMTADALAGFDRDDCLRLALHLRLPLWVDGTLPLPLRVEVPLDGAGFTALVVQTVREECGGEEISAFVEGDDPFDENYGALWFGTYGVGPDGMSEHIADRRTYAGARELVGKLVPALPLPERPVAFRGRRGRE